MRNLGMVKAQFKVGMLTTLITLTLVGCGETDVQQTTSPKVRPALTEIVQTQSLAELSFNGVIQSAKRTDLSFRINGRLSEIGVNEGDAVSQGQWLASLDQREAKTELASAKIELNNLAAEFKRAKTIFEKSQAISKADLDKITSQFELAKNAVEDAQRRLEYTQLSAPFDGVIARKLVDNFVQVQANQSIFILQNLNDLEVVINIPSRIVLTGERKTQAVAEISGIPNHQFPLTLKTFASQPDPVSQTYPVVLSFGDLKGYNVLPGMTVKVLPDARSESPGKQIITLPLTAVVPDNQGAQFVWVVDKGNKVNKRYVEVGTVSQDRVVITENLKSGEQVIVAGASSLQDGMEVRPYTDERNGA